MFHAISAGRSRVSRPGFLLAVLGFLAGGCGLADYEAKIEQAQKFLVYVDEENSLLDVPIMAPPKKGAPDPKLTGAFVPGGNPQKPVEVQMFFRPPRFVDSKYQEEPLGEFLYIYPGKVMNIPWNQLMFPKEKQTSNPKDGGYFDGVYVGVSRTKPRNEFWNDILRSLPINVDASAIKKGDVKTPLRRPPMVFDSVARSNEQLGKVFYAYVYEGDASVQPDSPDRVEERALVGIVYIVPLDLASKPEVPRAIDFSLQSLGIGREANLARAQYRPPLPPPPPAPPK